MPPRKPSEAKEKGPRKASEKKDPLNLSMVRLPKKPGEVKKALSKLVAANKKVPKIGYKQGKKFSLF